MYQKKLGAICPKKQYLQKSSFSLFWPQTSLTFLTHVVLSYLMHKRLISKFGSFENDTSTNLLPWYLEGYKEYSLCFFSSQ